MITVITSVYNGNQYLSKLLQMIQANTLCLQSGHPDQQVEYLLINDSPWIPMQIPAQQNACYTLRPMDNPENYGIHKSRARGILEAAGDLICILDQDDEIADTFLLSQFEALGNESVVVCNGRKEFDARSKPIYKDSLKMG